mgnify:CR=1 FL=1
MSTDTTQDQGLNRRSFLRNAAAAAGGLAFTQWAFSNFEAAAQNGQDYVIVADVARFNGGDPQGPSCVGTSVFSRGEQVGWRAVVYDATTGELVNSPEAIADRGLSLTVEVEGQDNLEMEHGPHPQNSDNAIDFWTAAWIIPPNVSGKLRYAISVEDADGRTGRLELLGQTDTLTFPYALTIE